MAVTLGDCRSDISSKREKYYDQSISKSIDAYNELLELRGFVCFFDENARLL